MSAHSRPPTSVVVVFRAVALVPSPPLLVPELTGGGASETDAVRRAALDAATRLGRVATRWIALGVADEPATVPPVARGSFRGYGVDVEVGLSTDAAQTDDRMPLAALIAGWLRGHAVPGAVVEARIVAADTDASTCRRLGHELRQRMDADDEDWGVLVVADGCTTLTPKAPGSFDDRAAAFQSGLDDALERADVSFLAGIDRDLCRELGASGAAAWQVSAAVVGDDVVNSIPLHRGAPFGVGYFAGFWEPSA